MNTLTHHTNSSQQDVTEAALLDTLLTTLTDHKAQDITQLDVRELTDVTDILLICTATSTRHSQALANRLIRATRDIDIRPNGIDGEQPGDWIVLDYLDVVVHIFTAETRAFYALEKLWRMPPANRANTAHDAH